MKTYELTYIISPEISSEEAEAKAKEIEATVQKMDGVILHQSNPVAKTLAYPISKSASGFLAIVEFQLEPEKLNELATSISKDGKIVRHMIIIKEAGKTLKKKRERTAPQFTKGPQEPKAAPAEKIVADKIELKDIEQQLDEILGE